MINIFTYDSYKTFVLDLLEARPNHGRGEFARIAEVAQTHKSTISQVFRGEKHLGPEQAVRVAKHLGLGPRQVRFFVLLVDHERAGSEDLRALYHEQILAERESNLELAERLPRAKELTGEEKAIFYSSWIYSAIRILSAIDGYQDRAEIARRLNLNAKTVEQAVEFLLGAGLCVETKAGLAPGTQSTYLESGSPLIARHHGNWRVKALERHPMLNAKEELAYSAPLALSSRDVLRVREILAQAIERADSVIGPSPSERLFCLNVDWFEIR